MKPKRQKRLFALLAMTVMPLLSLGALEAGLRVFGYGFPVGFFLKGRFLDKTVVVENEKFGRRFFPPSLARTPQPLLLPAQKPAGSYRIFVLGESAAMGDPEPAFGMARMLETLLRARYPGARFEVVNAAMTAINSHSILPIARDCAKLKGDLWIVYTGNNEVIGPFGSGTLFGPQAPSLALIRARLALQATKTGQLLEDLMRYFGLAGAQPGSWEGMEMFMEQRVRADDPRMAVVYHHFQSNLEAILQAGKRAGVDLILCTVGVNLRDSPPFASQHGRPLTKAENVKWEKAYQAGIKLEREQEFTKAGQHYEAAERIDADFAELQFRLGRCLEGSGRPADARQHYERACDLDTLRFRADSRINGIIRQTAARAIAGKADAVRLVDAQAILARHSLHGLPGNELFFEHVHLNFAGNYLLGRALAEQVATLLPKEISERRQAEADWLSEADCAERLACTAWDRYQVLAEMQRRMVEPPFTNQLNQQERQQRLRLEMAALLKDMRAQLAEMKEQYRHALALNPADWVLRDNFGKMLRANGDAGGAIEQWREAVRLMPHYVEAYDSLGDALESLGHAAEAKYYFSEAVRFKRDGVAALNGPGFRLNNEGGRRKETIEHGRETSRVDPGQGATRSGRELASDQEKKE
ncbi:MAG: tetratricopeptide repeat protein [Chloroflexi bacterium]|nr:tetratricopeptide repeat protein [Chloroflexota bacterium]